MVKSNGINMHCEVEGRAAGAPVVFVNSLGTDLRVFDALLPLLPQSLRFVRYDKRGHGLSDATPVPYKMADHVADLAGLLDALQVRGAVIVGLSIGGLIALGLSAARPDLVRAIVLMDTAHKIGNDQRWNDRITAIAGGGIGSIAEGIMAPWFSPGFYTERATELAGWRNLLTRTTVSGYVGSVAAIRDTNYEAEARALKVPVLGIAGIHDGATPPEVVKGTTDIIPGARFVAIEGAGHLPCVEAPEKVAAAMTGFFAENGIA